MFETKQMEEFDKYLNKVINSQDLILFEDAIKSANAGMYRSAYILAWLSCAESLKRRFKECGKQDLKANDLYSKIIKLEKEHKAADENILERAKNYGFINDYEWAKLKQLYELRCVYAHPYEAAPSKENVISAISDIVEIVLAKPALLSAAFIDTIIDKLVNDINYLNDYDVTVRKETQNWLNKINQKHYKYFIEKYSEIAEVDSKDNTKMTFTRRAKWVIEEILQKIQYKIYTNEEWHDFIIKYPNFSINLAINNKNFFLNIGERAQDYLISRILEIITYAPGYFQILASYLEDKDILRDNYSKIISKINSLSLDALKSSGLNFKFWFKSLLRELEAHDFNIKNAAVSVLEENESFINTLQNEQQFALGKALHIAALGNAWKAESYIKYIASQPNHYSTDFLKGFCSAFLCKNTERNYMYCREITLDIINLLLKNLNNNTEIVVFVNSLINEFINYEKETRENDFKEINEIYHFDRYSWFSLL